MTDGTKPESASEFSWYDSDMLLAAVNVDGGNHRTKEDHFIHGAYWQFCKHQDYYDRQEKTIEELGAALEEVITAVEHGHLIVPDNGVHGPGGEKESDYWQTLFLNRLRETLAKLEVK